MNIPSEQLNKLDQSQLDQHLIEACQRVSLDDVKYLLTSPELTRHASIKGWDEEAFICACRKGNMELIDYMLTSPELKEHSNVHAWRDMVFIEACNRKDVELLNYFVFDYKIDKTEEISKHLATKELTQISNLFERGDKAEKLTQADFPKPPKPKKKI